MHNVVSVALSIPSSVSEEGGILNASETAVGVLYVVHSPECTQLEILVLRFTKT